MYKRKSVTQTLRLFSLLLLCAVIKSRNDAALAVFLMA